MSKYLVTGGAGFIGSQIAETLLRAGEEVVVLDNLSSGKKENLELLEKIGGKFLFLKGDCSDPRACAEAVRGVQVVIHQAAQGSVPKSVLDPRSSHLANITGTLEVLIAAKDAGVKRFVNAASSSAYGDTPELPKRETMPPNTFSPYAVTKLAQETYCRAFAVSYGMETVSLRYFNVFGPRQDPHSQYAAVIPKFFQAFREEKSPTIYGDGEQTRDFTFVGDVVAANLSAAKISNAQGQVYNIAGGVAISINQLATKIAQIVGTSLRPTYEPARAGDIKHSLADISRAKADLHFDPKVDLDEGLRRCAEWYR